MNTTLRSTSYSVVALAVSTLVLRIADASIGARGAVAASTAAYLLFVCGAVGLIAAGAGVFSPSRSLASALRRLPATVAAVVAVIAAAHAGQSRMIDLVDLMAAGAITVLVWAVVEKCYPAPAALAAA